MGSSSARNCEARKRVPICRWQESVSPENQGGGRTAERNPEALFQDGSDAPADGLSPNWTICRKLTPVAGKLA